MKIPQPKSIGEETLARDIRALKIMPPERELKFHPTRKWKFDFAWTSIKLALEVEGGTKYNKSRHTKHDGFEGDCIKYAEASLLGWTVIRFTTQQIMSGIAISYVQKFLKNDRLK